LTSVGGLAPPGYQLNQAKVFPAPIITSIEPGKTFYPAETYRQNYLTLHPNNPYIAPSTICPSWMRCGGYSQPCIAPSPPLW
jgi:hypothetical protein